MAATTEQAVFGERRPAGRREIDRARRSLRLLSGFELRAGPILVALPLNAQRLVAFLAVRERPQLRRTVANSLWMDTTEPRAAANLRTALWKIRQLCDGVVHTSGSYLWLDPDADVDLTTLVEQAKRLIGPGESLDAGDTDTAALSGDLLPHWDEDWIQFERERLRQLRVHALEALCCRLSRCGRYAEAVDVGQTAVAAEPLRESAQSALIGAHVSEGNICEAKRQFAMFRAQLWESLRLPPSDELRAMVGAGV